MNRLSPPGARTQPVARPALWAAIAAASLMALMLLYRPYAGIAHDGLIYIGRTLADLDPAGIGRDMMFVNDGQSGFSLFPRIARVLVGAIGPGPASQVIALTGLCLWLAAAGALVSRLASGRLLWAALVCVIVLPPNYGGVAVFGYGEALAIPRPFAEAAVMASLAALLGGRTVMAVGGLLLAGLLHPLMALPGAAVALVVVAARDRRWWWLAAAGAAAVVAGAALGLPVASRLFQVMDPQWLGILRARTAYLFPTLWEWEDASRSGVQLASLIIAAGFLAGRARTLLIAVAGVAAAGVLATLLLGDLLPSLLVAQLQPWRAGWLLAVVGNAGAAIAAAGLWRGGPPMRLALAALALAWLTVEVPFASLIMAVGAVGSWAVAARGRPFLMTPGAAKAVGWIVRLVAVLWLARLVIGVGDYLAIGLRAGAPVGWIQVLGTDLPRLTVAALAIVVALRQAPSRPRTMAVALAAAALGLVALAAWDQRPIHRRALDGRWGQASLVPLLRGSAGEILWLEGDAEAWLLAGRPNWGAAVQGASVVFSRDLAVRWDERARTLVALKLVKPGLLEPFRGQADRLPAQARPAALAAVCRRPDAPSLIVLPGPGPAGAPSVLWRGPAPQYFSARSGVINSWKRIDDYAVIRCDALLATVSAPRP